MLNPQAYDFVFCLIMCTNKVTHKAQSKIYKLAITNYLIFYFLFVNSNLIASFADIEPRLCNLFIT